jgi:hypothetical protein
MLAHAAMGGAHVFKVFVGVPTIAKTRVGPLL